MELGSVMTACALFEKMEMWEECIECLSISGNTDKAKKLAMEKVSNSSFFYGIQKRLKIIQHQNYCVFMEI